MDQHIPDRDAPSSDGETAPAEQPSLAGRIGRRGIVATALAAPTFLTLGRASAHMTRCPDRYVEYINPTHGTKYYFNKKTGKKGKTCSIAASVKSSIPKHYYKPPKKHY